MLLIIVFLFCFFILHRIGSIYEGEPDEDAGELLDADFTLDPDKVEKNTRHAYI